MRGLFGWQTSADDVWQIELKRKPGVRLLGERHQTQVDVLLRNQTSVVVLECKFTEADGGGCSQLKPLPRGTHKGVCQCDGSYREQVNPVSGKRHRCPLSGKGIRYWEHIPDYFDLSADQDHIPCPFAGPAYQYMRNVLVAGQPAKQWKATRAGFGLVYVAGDRFPMACQVSDPDSEWIHFKAHLRKDGPLVIGEVACQHLLTVWSDGLPGDATLVGLQDWVEDRCLLAERAIRPSRDHVPRTLNRSEGD